MLTIRSVGVKTGYLGTRQVWRRDRLAAFRAVQAEACEFHRRGGIHVGSQ
jgi:hypothetical protein